MNMIYSLLYCRAVIAKQIPLGSCYFFFDRFMLSALKLNPSKLEKNEDVNLNLTNLLTILSELVEKIFMAAEILPP